jgi:hypothetical protein
MTEYKLLIAITLVGVMMGTNSIASDKEVALYKTPNCGCCDGYADYLRENGFNVKVNPTDKLGVMSREAGMPGNFQGCHLSFIDGYFVSGHVPISAINKLLSERPAVKGITLPSMPLGSPGMSGVKSEPFTTYSIGEGEPKVYTVE